MPNRPETGSFRITPRLVLGVGVILFGVILTADRLGFQDAEAVFDYWPILLVAVGATRLPGRGLSDRVFALFWIGIGLWLLAWNLDYTDMSPIEVFWPVVLILLGLSLVFGALRRSRPSAASDARVNIVAVMGGVDRTNSSVDFLGGDVTVFMGGGELDLRQAQIPEGPAMVQVFTLWGGYGFKVPPTWNVSLEVLPLLAGVEDKRTLTEQRAGEPQASIVRLEGDEGDREPEREQTAPMLIVRGVVIMGGIEVSN